MCGHAILKLICEIEAFFHKEIINKYENKCSNFRLTAFFYMIFNPIAPKFKTFHFFSVEVSINGQLKEKVLKI